MLRVLQGRARLVVAAIVFFATPRLVTAQQQPPQQDAGGYKAPTAELERHTVHAILAELKTPAAVLLSLLLFFQLGNEWAIAGWLPLYLSQRLGMSPESSLLLLALYWFALLIGRAISQWMLPRVAHSRMLTGSVVAALTSRMNAQSAWPS